MLQSREIMMTARAGEHSRERLTHATLMHALPACALIAWMIFAPAAEAQTPSPGLLITIDGEHSHDHQPGALAIADPLTGKVVARVPIGGHPHEVVVSEDGKLAFVTKTSYSVDPERVPDDTTISVIDLTEQKEVRRVEIGPGSGPHALAFVGGKLYYTAEGYKLIGRYDPVKDRIDQMVGIGQESVHELVVSKNQQKIFTANSNSNSVTAIEPSDPPGTGGAVFYRPRQLWKTTVIPVGKGPEGIAMSPDEKELWVLNRSDGNATIIDTGTKKILRTLELNTKEPMRMQFTPDGKRAIIIDGTTGDVLVLDAEERKELKRINVGNHTHSVLITPDGLRAYIAVIGGDNVAVLDLKTLTITGRIASGDAPEELAWVERK